MRCRRSKITREEARTLSHVIYIRIKAVPLCRGLGQVNQRLSRSAPLRRHRIPLGETNGVRPVVPRPDYKRATL